MPSISTPSKPVKSGGMSALLAEYGGVSVLTAAPSCVRWKVAALGRFFAAFHITNPRQLKEPVIRQYLAQRLGEGRALATVINERCAISTFCDFLEGKELLKHNPCMKIRLPRPEERVPAFLDEKECVAAIAKADGVGIGPEFKLAIATGLRLGELRLCQWADIDTQRRILLVPKSKSHRPRTVPLSKMAMQAIAAQAKKSKGFGYVFPTRHTHKSGFNRVDAPRSKWWWVEAIRPVADSIGKFQVAKSGSVNRGWHLLRHTFASRLAQKGVSLYKIASWMGHSDVRMTRVYAHLQAAFDPDIECPCKSPARKRRRASIETRRRGR